MLGCTNEYDKLGDVESTILSSASWKQKSFINIQGGGKRVTQTSFMGKELKDEAFPLQRVWQLLSVVPSTTSALKLM